MQVSQREEDAFLAYLYNRALAKKEASSHARQDESDETAMEVDAVSVGTTERIAR